jgi:hypothetical protein
MEFANLYQTCDVCPSQWEGRTPDDRPIYIRYRWGVLEIGIGKPGQDISAAVEKAMTNPDVCETLGGGFDGEISFSKVKPYLDKIKVEEGTK